MSSHSGTIGRSNGRSMSSGGSGGGGGSSGGGGGNARMRRQRSVEWHHAHGYSSSDDDERGVRGTINPSFDSQLLAQLIAQSQELSNKCKWIFFHFLLLFFFSYDNQVSYSWQEGRRNDKDELRR